MRNRNCLLIVDDEPDIRLLLETYAAKNGFSPLLAENGQQAMDIVEQYQPDAVISDIMMPEMDGMEFLRQMKTKEYDIPVILMTAYGTIDRAVEAMKSGAADFITKPVSPDYLLQVVRRVFKQAELERKVHEHEKQLKADLHLASLVQRCMLPREMENRCMGLHLRYEPLLEIGGDYLATRQYSEERLAIALYDVSGHGVSAALLATMLHHELTDLLAVTDRPHEIIQKINYYASDKFNATGLFCTMALIWVDAGKGLLTAVNAGHPDILIWKKERNDFEIIAPHIPPIGLQMEDVFESRLTTTSLSSGDRILLYTDGFTESRRENYDVLGEEGFRKIAREWIVRPPDELIDGVFQATRDFRQGDSNDDQTLLVVDVK